MKAGKVYHETPGLEININVYRSGTQNNYSASLKLQESVQSLRNSKMVIQSATTYEDSLLGNAGDLVAAQAIREEVLTMVDRFCNDWLKANPK
jgi:hypothetical protein